MQRDPREGTEVSRSIQDSAEPLGRRSHGVGDRFGDLRGLWKMFVAEGCTPFNRKGKSCYQANLPTPFWYLQLTQSM